MSRRSTGFDRLTVEALYLRCEGLCEGCGMPLRGERGAADGHAAHHRRPRRMGGSQLPDTGSVENGMMLNADCHRYIEAARSWAYDNGFLVRQGDFPALIPARLYAVPLAPGRFTRMPYLALLTDDAGYRPVEDVTL